MAIGDYDGDDLPDLYLTRPFGGGPVRNLGEFRFEDVTGPAGLGADEFWQAAPSFVDIDNDGDLDLYVCAFNAANRLYINQDGKFTESAKEAGLDFNGFSINMAFADYDLDGDMDGYLVTNRPYSPTESYDVTNRALAQRVYRQLEKDAAGKFRMPDHLREIFDIIWNPRGRWTCSSVPGSTIISTATTARRSRAACRSLPTSPRRPELLDNGMGLSATWFDYDGDRFPDLYVANDYYGADHLFHNAGDGTFKRSPPKLCRTRRGTRWEPTSPTSTTMACWISWART